MQILEKILQEIEDEMRYYRKVSTDGRITYGIASHRDCQAKGTAEGLQKAMQIIRSHMGDEPVSNPDKLDDGWIPEENPPKDQEYILLSFENFSIPLVGRYEEDEEGGAYYLGDDEKSCLENDLFVNAWQPLPLPYRPEEG